MTAFCTAAPAMGGCVCGSADRCSSTQYFVLTSLLPPLACLGLAWLLHTLSAIDLARVAVVSVYACKLTAKGSTDTAVWSMMKSVSKVWGTSLSTAPVKAITNVELLG